jgi:hypothetical protein
VYILLSESDRERLGAPEKLLVKLEDVTAREQATLQHAFRYDDTAALAQALASMYSYDPATNMTTFHRKVDPMVSLVWLALRQAEILKARSRTEMAAELDDLDADLELNKVDIEEDEQERAVREEQEAAAAGKDSSSTPTRTSTD